MTCPTFQNGGATVEDIETVTRLALRVMLEIGRMAWPRAFISTWSMNSHSTFGPMCTAGPAPTTSENATSNEQLWNCTEAAPALPAPLPLESRPMRNGYAPPKLSPSKRKRELTPASASTACVVEFPLPSILTVGPPGLFEAEVGP